ncbi:hypothetical protein SFRURICE_005401 [Spodoptera frugiperda]|nr:hypothetical protein SFRURICE_005401 [Spodoptera frugiperda]
MTRNNNLWITQRVAPCGNRTRYPVRGSQLPIHRTNRAVESSPLPAEVHDPEFVSLYRVSLKSASNRHQMIDHALRPPVLHYANIS